MNSCFKFLHIVLCISLLLIIGCTPFPSGKKQPLAVHGVIDLRGWDFEKDGGIPLNGEWLFFWEKFLTPEDFTHNLAEKNNAYFLFPGVWNGYTNSLKKTPSSFSGFGYASFALTILHNSHNQQLAFEIEDMSSAYEFFVDENKISFNGIVGTTPDSMTPEYRPAVVHFKPESHETKVFIHISNFHHRKGGPWKAIKLGSENQILAQNATKLFLNTFIMGSIFIMGLYHLGLYILRRKFISPLYFGIFCCLVSLRSLVTNERYLHIIFPQISWEILLKMEYLSFYLSVPVFAMFISTFLPREFSRKILKIILAIAFAFSFIVLVTPARIYSYSIQAYQLLTLFSCMYIFYVFFRAYKKKREGVLILITGSILLSVFVFYDILQANELVETEPFLPVGMFMFIFCQALLLSSQFSQALTRVEKQKSRLLKINIAVKKEINERKQLEQTLVKSDQQVKNSRIALILGLAKLSEYRDEDTGRHLERICEYTKILAIELSKKEAYREYITEDYINDIYQSAILHDIGKVGIKDSILLKPGKLTTDEFDTIKAHAVIGGDAISAIESQMQSRSFLTLARDIAYCHHEKWDGSGYPNGLKEKEIPLSARITAVADVYDALTSERPYKKAFPHEKAVTIIMDESGKHFDPNIIKAFVATVDLFKEIRKNMLE